MTVAAAAPVETATIAGTGFVNQKDVEILRHFSEGVRDEMMVAMLGVLQGAAIACTEICLQRLHGMYEQLTSCTGVGTSTSTFAYPHQGPGHEFGPNLDHERTTPNINFGKPVMHYDLCNLGQNATCPLSDNIDTSFDAGIGAMTLHSDTSSTSTRFFDCGSDTESNYDNNASVEGLALQVMYEVLDRGIESLCHVSLPHASPSWISQHPSVGKAAEVPATRAAFTTTDLETDELVGATRDVMALEAAQTAEAIDSNAQETVSSSHAIVEKSLQTELKRVEAKTTEKAMVCLSEEIHTATDACELIQAHMTRTNGAAASAMLPSTDSEPSGRKRSNSSGSGMSPARVSPKRTVGTVKDFKTWTPRGTRRTLHPYNAVKILALASKIVQITKRRRQNDRPFG